MLRGLGRKAGISLLSDGLGWRQQGEVGGQARVWLGAGWRFSSGAPLPTHLFSSS